LLQPFKMKQERIRQVLDAIKKVRVAIYGDFCLDAYWIMDPRGSEVSVETGKQAEAVQRHYYSPGGASNIAANLAALQPAEIKAIGVIGDDIFGRELSLQLKSLKVDLSSLVMQKRDFNTYTFTKKYRDDEEEPRIDFGTYNTRSTETDDHIIRRIRDALMNFDVLIFNQQVPGSITNPSFIDRVNELFDEFNDRIIILDSRHFNERFRNIYRKTNSVEIARMNGVIKNPGDYIPMKDVAGFGEKIYGQFHKPVFVTCGERGIIVIDSEGIHRVDGIQFLKRLDPVGAGDTILSALALCLAAGLKPAEAAEFANLAAAVTVQKLFITGTASGDEIIAVSREPDYLYRPDLSEEPGLAEYFPGSRIEICDKEITEKTRRVKHAVFDHDGTISTLRMGWPEVMEKMMINSITGNLPTKIPAGVLSKITERVKDYIEKSTGVQTLIQMEALVEMVAEYNLAPEEYRPDKFEFKKIYNQAITAFIWERLERIRLNPSSAKNHIIPGAIEFLTELKKPGVTLYLVSGTDQEYVEQEAALLGYAGLFAGNIFGAQDDIANNSKKTVISDIIQNNKLERYELAVFGDGPVEIRESLKQGGLAIGVATDESTRKGINLQKRSKLIKAGAHAIIPDFNDYQILSDMLSK
jgi:rfaE bifunctional protein kinase chain/domain